MNTKLFAAIFLFSSFSSVAQNGWTVCNAPVFNTRVDDIYMVNAQTGYAVAGDGKIVKTIDGGENWAMLLQNNSVYCRSVEFINTQKGFVGAFPVGSTTTNILRRTTDGGITWTDLTSSLDPRARKGICGLAVADNNTIYGGGNWYGDKGYIVKSTDGGDTWSFIDMSAYASSIIDLSFKSKDTGFATGKDRLPNDVAILLYTTDGGATWSYKYSGIALDDYCWKIQRLTPLIYYASLQNSPGNPAKTLQSLDGGMTWKIHIVSPTYSHLQGVGFIDPMHGWTGGSDGNTFETKDGGKTWTSLPGVCDYMNRVFRINDSTIFATGRQIWKYRGTGLYPAIPQASSASMNCHPNPVKGILTINIALLTNTHLSVLLLDATGRRVKVIDNTDRAKGSYQFYVETGALPQGLYYVVLMTHEEKLVSEIVVSK